MSRREGQARLLALPVGVSTLAISLALRVLGIAEPIFTSGLDLCYTIHFKSVAPIRNLSYRPVYFVRNIGFFAMSLVTDVVLVGFVASSAGIISPPIGFHLLGRF